MIRSFLVPLVAVILALLAGAVLIAAAGVEPGAAYGRLLQGALGIDPAWRVGQPLVDLIARPGRLGNTAAEAIPLILAGLAVALPFRAGLFNVGGEGQIYLGGLGATLVGLYLTGLPPILHVPLALGAGIAGGAGWGALAGLLRARRGLNEIITTIMLNFIAFWLVSYLVHGPLKDPASFGYAWTPEVLESARLPVLFDRARIDLGFGLALLAALVMGFVLWRTTFGFEVRMTGHSATVAHATGIPVRRATILVMALGGGLAGLAGACVVLGQQHRLSTFFSPGYGFDAIAVALVGGAQPAGVLASGLFFGALRTGAEAMETAVGVPKSIALVIQALTLLFVAVSLSPRIARWFAQRRAERMAP